MTEDQQELCIDLAEVTETYEKGLLDRLRGFGAEESIFETWVPDADPQKSIQNLIDAAIEAHFDGALAIAIPESMLSEGQLRLLAESLELPAEVAPESPGNWRLRLSGFADALVDASEISRSISRTRSGASAQSSDLQSKEGGDRKEHREEKVSRNVLYDLPVGNYRNHNSLMDDPGVISVTSARGPWQLTLQVDSKSHTVVKAGFLGLKEDSIAPLLDKVCDQAVGRPVADVGDHSISRLEFSIRQRRLAPVTGIALPLAVDERFEILQHLVRDAVEAYRQQSGFQERENTFFDTPAASWTALEAAEQKLRIGVVLGAKAAELGFSKNEIEVVDVEYEVRVLVRFLGEMASLKTDKQALIMVLERALVEQLDARLELFLELVKDQSVLRRLGGKEG